MTKDVTIRCQDCGKEFKFSEKEQAFYEEHKFLPPKRCKECRVVRKIEKQNRYNK